MERGEQPGRNGKGLSVAWMSRSTHLCGFLSCQALLFFSGRVAIKLQFCSPISEAARTKRRGTRSYVCTSRPGLSGLSASSMHKDRQSWCGVKGKGWQAQDVGRNRTAGNLGGLEQSS